MKPDEIKFAKEELRRGLKTCTKAQQRAFILIYSPDRNKPNISLDEVIDNMPKDQIQPAIKRVYNTIKKNMINRYDNNQDLSTQYDKVVETIKKLELAEGETESNITFLALILELENMMNIFLKELRKIILEEETINAK